MARKNDYIVEVDQFVGNKIYSLRLAKGLSRQQLASVIDVTHQQLQKYEKGTNRISVGRLVLIAKALEKNVNYFYEGLDSNGSEPIMTHHQRMCIEVSRNFMKIENSEHQNAVNSLVKSLSKIA
ncbi:MAG: helix-turn-helix transcriptional regulator [Rickettsiaceae bacterium]|nr:helix-turn-helix transcriptional regulator [Rickettsiaceae bacterium]